MRSIICNPLNIGYRYQFYDDPRTGQKSVAREAADPSVILFRERYYLFASMTLGVWASDDLAHWTYHRLPDGLPGYDYAPDARVVGDWVYVCASALNRSCDFYRTQDVVNGPYERIEGSFPFWDPNLFADDDGRLYFYWGCSSVTPLWGVELDARTLRPLGEKRVLLESHPLDFGYERNGEENALTPLTDEEVETRFAAVCAQKHIDPATLPPDMIEMGRGFLKQTPYIEGAWMTKHGGKYYLQYAVTGTQFNVYADGVAAADSPLGPFAVAKDNPYSLKLGGFIEGAGHGSTLEDAQGAWWKAATLRVSVNHVFERRIGLWPAGFDEDGALFANQRYGDWPLDVERARENPWAQPEWMLLSYRANATASSAAEGHAAALATDENIRTWWQAASDAPGAWLVLDLGREMDVRAVQVNFADDTLAVATPGEINREAGRYIDEAERATRWLLEASTDGLRYDTLADRRGGDGSRPHELIVAEDGVCTRYLRLTIDSVPFGAAPCVSGLRAFGTAEGDAPSAPIYRAARTGELDARVEIAAGDGATGHLVLWGSAPDKLYHCRETFEQSVCVTSLLRGEKAFFRVDAWNESGIAQGETILEV